MALRIRFQANGREMAGSNGIPDDFTNAQIAEAADMADVDA
jgi:hypothetical protein